MRKQTGFTLIEIAIVLVIIGLLLGGVLKGQGTDHQRPGAQPGPNAGRIQGGVFRLSGSFPCAAR